MYVIRWAIVKNDNEEYFSKWDDLGKGYTTILPTREIAREILKSSKFVGKLPPKAKVVKVKIEEIW